MSAPMVRAILDGKKTQTRRVMKRPPPPFVQQTPDKHPPKHPEPYIDAYCGERKSPENPRGMGVEWYWWTRDDRPGYPFGHCPYGQPGDRLWVRETFVRGYKTNDCGELVEYDEDGNQLPLTTWYRASDEIGEWLRDGEDLGTVPWKPSIHMPRALSRITLELTDVRVQRVREIRAEDCYEEGLRRATKDERIYKWGCDGMDWVDWRTSPMDAFHGLWDSLNAKRGFGWDVNPWVWALTFKRVESAA